MPVISRFYGITILMYFDDHQPPHFHARSGGFEVTVEIESGKIYGPMPPRGLGLLREFTVLRRAELLDNWHRARLHDRLWPVEPLE